MFFACERRRSRRLTERDPQRAQRAIERGIARRRPESGWRRSASLRDERAMETARAALSSASDDEEGGLHRDARAEGPNKSGLE
jgi:hypothetical protein